MLYEMLLRLLQLSFEDTREMQIKHEACLLTNGNLCVCLVLDGVDAYVHIDYGANGKTIANNAMLQNVHKLFFNDNFHRSKQIRECAEKIALTLL